LIALKKKDGGIRPIAVSNTMRRLASKLVYRKGSHLAGQLLPHQLGFGVRGGAEAALHATRQFMSKSTTPTTILKIDFKNAFNCVSRSIFINKI
jgi:hypothetical protein